jgi:hypothetical protein
VVLVEAGLYLGLRNFRRGFRSVYTAQFVLALTLLMLVLIEARLVGPSIAELHAQGAVRGIAELGARLDAFHVWAKRIGTVELILTVLYVGLGFRFARRGEPRLAP